MQNSCCNNQAYFVSELKIFFQQLGRAELLAVFKLDEVSSNMAVVRLHIAHNYAWARDTKSGNLYAKIILSFYVELKILVLSRKTFCNFPITKDSSNNVWLVLLFEESFC